MLHRSFLNFPKSLVDLVYYQSCYINWLLENKRWKLRCNCGWPCFRGDFSDTYAQRKWRPILWDIMDDDRYTLLCGDIEIESLSSTSIIISRIYLSGYSFPFGFRIEAMYINGGPAAGWYMQVGIGVTLSQMPEHARPDILNIWVQFWRLLLMEMGNIIPSLFIIKK